MRISKNSLVIAGALVVMAAVWVFGNSHSLFYRKATGTTPAESHYVIENGVARLDLNAATAAELTELPGIGETLSARIVAYRQEHGDFTSIDVLLQVEGLGESTLEGIRKYLTVQ